MSQPECTSLLDHSHTAARVHIHFGEMQAASKAASQLCCMPSAAAGSSCQKTQYSAASQVAQDNRHVKRARCNGQVALTAYQGCEGVVES